MWPYLWLAPVLHSLSKAYWIFLKENSSNSLFNNFYLYLPPPEPHYDIANVHEFNRLRLYDILWCCKLWEESPIFTYGYIIVLGLRTKKQPKNSDPQMHLVPPYCPQFPYCFPYTPFCFALGKLFLHFSFCNPFLVVINGPTAMATLLPVHPSIEVMPVEVRTASKRRNSSCPWLFLTSRNKREVDISLAHHFPYIVHKWLNNEKQHKIK